MIYGENSLHFNSKYDMFTIIIICTYFNYQRPRTQTRTLSTPLPLLTNQSTGHLLPHLLPQLLPESYQAVAVAAVAAAAVAFLPK